MKQKFKLLIIGLVGLGVVTLIAGWWVAGKINAFTADAFHRLPKDLMADLPKTTTITDRKGQVLYYYYQDQNRLMTTGDQIPNHLKEAFIAAEDERFYLHSGFDPISALRAAWGNWRNQSVLSGGSTLTMQLVKNLTGDASPTLARKLREAYLASLIETRYTKDQVLTAYLNVVPLGSNLAGVETASRFYFNKPVSQLSLAESATLAALPTAPEFYIQHPESLERRRNYVLDRMVDTGKITREAAKTAQAAQTATAPVVVPLQAPHFTMHVLDELKARYGESLAKQGLTVQTSLDPAVQSIAEQTVEKERTVLRQVNAQNVGLVSVDPKTGQVLAMVGSANYQDKTNQGEVNLATARLSYGSTAKPLIMAFLLEQEHWSPGAIMWDVKTDFPIQGEPKPYTPKNYDLKYFGPLTVRQALANSRNVTAIKALQMVGLPTVLNRFKEMGVTSLRSPSDYGPSFAVGGGEIPLVELVGAYTALANNGKVNRPQSILKLTDPYGKVIEETKPTNTPAIKPEVAYEIADILQDNEARKRVFGSQSPLVIKDHTVAAKTGTAEDYRTALTIGFTPEVVTGVIVANNDNRPLRFGGSGAMAAAPFFHTFMTEFLKDKPNTWFTRPETVQATEFPTVIGKIKDLTAPWQSPSPRFAERVAETDNPYWNRAVRSQAQPKEETKVATQTVVTETVKAAVPAKKKEGEQ